jgi:hypothetical protein
MINQITKSTTIDWSSPDILNQIVQNIKNPLDTIITASKPDTVDNKGQNEIIFSSSKQINDIIEEILKEIKSNFPSISFFAISVKYISEFKNGPPAGIIG